MTAAAGVVADPGRAGTTPDPAAVVVRGVTVAAVVVVAVIAAVVSYSHMQQLAHAAGEGWRSWLIPLSIDGLVVAASMVLVTRRRSGSGGGGGSLAWGALGAGVAASLAANMADARPELTAVLVAGWPAVAFAVALELLLQQRRAQHHAPPPAPAPAPVPSPARASVPVAPGPAGAPGPLPPVPPVPVPVVADPLQRRVRELIGRAGRVPGRRVVARELGISEHQARVALERVTAPPPGHDLSLNAKAPLAEGASFHGAGGISR